MDLLSLEKERERKSLPKSFLLLMYEKLQEILKTGYINAEKEGVNRYANGASVKKK